MRKRKLSLDKEILTQQGVHDVNGAFWPILIAIVGLSIGYGSAAEPDFCDCYFDSESCPSEGCTTGCGSGASCYSCDFTECATNCSRMGAC